MIAAVVSLFLALLGGLAWCWKLHESDKIKGVKLERAEQDISETKTEVRTLRDGHVRMDTTVELMQARLASLDQLPTIAASVKATETTVTELKQQMIPREVLEARFKAIESKLP